MLYSGATLRCVARWANSALATVTHDWFAGRFATLGQHGYAGAGDERDLAYTWHWFEQMRAFFARTAAE
jgi:hypothetical protein